MLPDNQSFSFIKESKGESKGVFCLGIGEKAWQCRKVWVYSLAFGVEVMMRREIQRTRMTSNTSLIHDFHNDAYMLVVPPLPVSYML